MKLQFAIRTSPTGGLLADWSNQARDVRWSTGPHGFRSLRARIPRSLLAAFQFYRTSGALHVEINAGAYRVWEGRLDDPALLVGQDGSEIEIQALGYWQAYRDLLYTALWSTTDISGWEPLTNDETPGTDYTPERWEFGQQQDKQIWMSPKKNTFVVALNGRGGIRFVLPDRGRKTITRVLFDYFQFLPNSEWRGSIDSYAYDSSAQTFSYAGFTPWILLGSGATQVGTVDVTFAGSNALVFQVLKLSGAAVTLTAETGTHYLRIRNLRILTTANATLDPSEIVQDLLAFVRESNPDQADSATFLINAPGIDLDNEIYEDLTPAEILQRLALLGDTQDNRYEVGVRRNRRLYFRRRGSAARRWIIDATGLDIQQSRELLANRAYARYQDASGRTLRTANANDTVAQNRFGLVRQRLIDADGTSQTTAEQLRDTFLEDNANPRPRAGVAFDRLYTEQGQQAPLWMVESGDIVTIRNLPPGLGADVDRIRTFYVAETEYDVDRRFMRIVPEEPLPTLDALLARQDALAAPVVRIGTPKRIFPATPLPPQTTPPPPPRSRR